MDEEIRWRMKMMTVQYVEIIVMSNGFFTGKPLPVSQHNTLPILVSPDLTTDAFWERRRKKLWVVVYNA